MAAMQAVARASSSIRADTIVNAVCPDLCSTVDKTTGYLFLALFARTAEEGSRSLVCAAVLGLEIHGQLWHHDILFP